MAIWAWSTTAASNTTLEGVTAAEGMAPGLVNNLVRAIAAGLKKWALDTGGALTTAGNGAAYTLTTNSGLTALVDGVEIAFVCNITNVSVGVTLNVDGLGIKQVQKLTGANTADVSLNAGDMLLNGHYIIRWDASAFTGIGCWILLNPENRDRLRLHPHTATIASGVITRTGSFMTIDTEGLTATDNLDTINGGAAGDILILQTAISTRDVTVRDAVDNIQLPADRVLDNAKDKITLIYDGSTWCELSFANNT